MHSVIDKNYSDRSRDLLQIIFVFVLLYLFLLGINMMGGAFKSFGKGFAEQVLAVTSNPFISLFIGIFSTTLVQSSSTTTSVIVSFVATGMISIENAVPMVMGANIGTTVTNTIVSLGHVNRPEEFRRALSAATVHDFFNYLCVLVFLPLETMTGFLRKTAIFLAGFFQGSDGGSFKGPLSYFVKPITKMLKVHLVEWFGTPWGYIILLIIGVGLTFLCLFYIVKSLKSVMMQRIGSIISKTVQKNGYLGILIGFILTIFAQSSSVTTSLLVPMAAAGMLSVERIYPITLGANVGTTFTAILAALATDNIQFALPIAFVHLLFNLSGIAVFYPIKVLRDIPSTLARGFANMASRNKILAIVYILGAFYLVPLILILIWK